MKPDTAVMPQCSSDLLNRLRSAKAREAEEVYRQQREEEESTFNRRIIPHLIPQICRAWKYITK